MSNDANLSAYEHIAALVAEYNESNKFGEVLVLAQLPDTIGVSRGLGRGKDRISGETTIDVTALPAHIVEQATVYGLVQKVADSLSDFPTVKGEAVKHTISRITQALDEVVQRLYAGMWNKPRESNGTSSGTVDLFTRALRFHLDNLCRANPDGQLARKVKDMKAAERYAVYDKVFAKNEDKLRPQVEAIVAGWEDESADELAM